MRMKQLRGYSVGSIAPTNPQTGDRWHELSPLGVSVYGWDWTWSTGRWVSPEQRHSASFNFNLDLFVHWFEVQQRPIQLLSFHAFVRHNVAQTNGQWRIRLVFVTDPEPFFLTTGNAPGVFTRYQMPLAGVVSNILPHFALVPEGSNPGRIDGSVTLLYQFVRP